MVEEKKKTQYKVRNWTEYSNALVKRGSLTIWFSEDVIESWLNKEKTGRRGRMRVYADVAIECMLIIQAVFSLPLRQTQGLIMSLMTLMGMDVPVPNYSTLSRRRKHLQVELPRKHRGKGFHVVVDSTGLKVFGYGEWYARKYYPKPDQKPRKNPHLWRKVHIGVDEATGEIVAVVTTEKDEHDKTMLPDLLDQIEDPVEQVTADKGYDYVSCYEAIETIGAHPVIPPRRNATIHRNRQFANRDAHVRRIREVGRKAWKLETGYHRRSLAETAVYRLKTIFGPKLSSRTLENQAVETRLHCKALNIMTHLGMPVSYPVPVAA